MFTDNCGGRLHSQCVVYPLWIGRPWMRCLILVEVEGLVLTERMTDDCKEHRRARKVKNPNAYREHNHVVKKAWYDRNREHVNRHKARTMANIAS